MKLFTTIYHDAQLLGHFLAHYSACGVSEFFIAVDNRFRQEVVNFSLLYNITYYSDLDVSDTVIGEVSAASKMREWHQLQNEWIIVVDLDEFVELRTDLNSIISDADAEGANVIRGIMWDRFTRDGRIADFDLAGDLKATYPVKARFIKNIMGGADYKAALVKGLLNSASAHHNFEDEIVSSHVLEISHYKWTSGAIDRLRAAHRMVVEAGEPWAIEYAKALDHYERHGRFAWEQFGGQFDPGI